MTDTTQITKAVQTPTEQVEYLPPTWEAIADAGGMQPWVLSELRRRNLLDEGVDPSTLSDKKRKQFKQRREEERRVKKILKAQAWACYRENHLVHLGPDIFHHDVADVDRFDIPEREERLAENELPELKNVQELAKALDISMGRLRSFAFHREVDTSTNYNRWKIPKRTGGERLISAPKSELKRVQAWIRVNISERLPVHGAAHGFIPDRSTLTNAQAHAGAKSMMKFDIKDFYPTITTNRVKGIFRKAGYIEQVANVLALIVTEAPREELMLRGKKRYVALGDRSLPQGAPTSPSLTNTICLRLDRRLSGLAKKYGFVYTRYADDLTFSWHSDGEPPFGKLRFGVSAIVAHEGFTIHPKKTRVQRQGRRMQVTGLVVNKQAKDQKRPDGVEAPSARVPRKVVRQLRAAIHNRKNGKPGKETLNQLQGMAAYVYMCDPDRGQKFLAEIAALRTQD